MASIRITGATGSVHITGDVTGCITYTAGTTTTTDAAQADSAQAENVHYGTGDNIGGSHQIHYGHGDNIGGTRQTHYGSGDNIH